MIRLIVVVLLLALTAGAAVWLTLNPGAATIEFLGRRYETPAAILFALLLIASFLMMILWRLIAFVWTAPEAFRRFRLRRRREQGFDALERALIASAAGQGELAVRQAARADALLDRPALSRLLAARAAEAAGDLPSAEEHYEALLEDPKTRLVARRGLAAIAEERGDPALTARYAGDAFNEARSARWAFTAYFDALIAQSRWVEAAETLHEGERAGHVPQDVAKRRRAVLLTAEAQRKAPHDPDAAADLAERAANASPAFAPAAAVGAKLLSERRRHRRAADLIENAWQAAPHPALARLYGELRKSDTKARRAERLTSLAHLNVNHRESHLLLAELALEAREAETARARLEAVFKMGAPSARVCALAARLSRLEGDEDAARRWMARASHAPGEADWSDIDERGEAFAYDAPDWRRMVYAYGDEGRLIHPRYERFEIAAEAVPERMLLEAPKARLKKAAPTSGGETQTPAPAEADAGSAYPAPAQTAATDRRAGPPQTEGADASSGSNGQGAPVYFEPDPAPDDPGVEPGPDPSPSPRR